MKVEEGFQPIKYPDEHPYLDDPVLPGLLKRLLPDSVRSEVEADLERLGKDLINKARPLAPQLHAAKLTQYDEWGRRVDLLQTSEGWRKLKETASKEGYIANAYERKYKELSRVYMFAKTMVMTGDYHVIVCPFSMTDGAVRLMELHGNPEMKKQILPRLISRNPEEAYFSGQWMTERIGGSDVSLTETVAKPTKRIASDLGEPYLIDGFKWFSSAAEGNMAFALARTGDASSGSRGLSLFLIPVRFQHYNTPLSNGVRIHRLKEKFGTIAVPTAELSLEGTRGWLVGPKNAGVKMISTLLNITRVHSSIHSIGSLQRALSIARSYATVRTVNRGTTLLQDIPLHVSGLANVSLLYRALTHFAFGVITLLGRSENGVASAEEESRLRLLTPVLKAFAAQKAVGGMEECMAALGGQGYMEETGIGRLIRDAMIEKIWEGTVEVLSIDLNRATASPTAVKHYTDWAFRTLSKGPLASLSSAKATLKSALDKLPALFHKSKTNPIMPRIMLNIVGNVTAGVYLYEHAIWAAETGERSKEVDVESCCRWVEEGDLAKCLEDVEAISANVDKRVKLNSAFVYGTQSKARL